MTRGSVKNNRANEATARVAAILRAATTLFLRQGFERTTLAAILSRSGGSKATLRKYFGNKAGLFAAVVTSATEEFVATVEEPARDDDPLSALNQIGVTVLSFYVRSDSLAAYRGVVSSGSHEPAMARAFYEKGHALVRSRIAQRLEAWHARGLVRCADSVRDADLFLHLLRAGLYEQSLIGLSRSASRADVRSTVSHAVNIFLYGISRGEAGRTVDIAGQ